jgi:hypothetical protein
LENTLNESFHIAVAGGLYTLRRCALLLRPC